MYLSNRELKAALASGKLICNPPPAQIDENSIDLRLDSIEDAKIWDMEAFKRHNRAHGYPDAELRVARIEYWPIALQFLIPPGMDQNQIVYRRHDELIIKPGGFLLWQTKEAVGTPSLNPEYLCFIDGKSTRARAGLLVHLTAPTIHSGWAGKVTLEIANLGPVDLVLKEDEMIAQITVAQLSSVPEVIPKAPRAIPTGQTDVSGGTK
jgi:dCTP deaminase